MPEGPTLADLESAARIVYAAMPPTPQYAWPLLAERAGCEVWVKHENHTPVGSFKVRGGLVFVGQLWRDGPAKAGLIAATRGNHGQSLAFAARRFGFPATVVVPEGNSREKNAAMRALGAELIVHGRDFHDALAHARALAAERGLLFVPSFDPLLPRGIASYALELFRTAPPLDAVYVPIGQGSGIAAVIAARDALGLSTAVIGVVSERLPSYALSFRARKAVETPPADTIADGVACRIPDPAGLEIVLRGAEDVVTVSEEEIRDAMRVLFSATHNVVEGAGAAALAAVLAGRGGRRDRRVAVVATGGNVDRDVFARVLADAPA